MRACEILNEMLIQYKQEGSSNIKYVLAFKQWIWIIEPYDTKETLPDYVIQDILEKTGINLNKEPDIQEIGLNRPDVFVGMLHNNTLMVDDSDLQQDPYASSLIKKTAKQLGVTKIELQHYDRSTTVLNIEQLPQNIPDYMYHGTNSRWINDIAKNGLVATSHSNWILKDKTIKTPGLVFMAANPNLAKFHANNSAAGKYIPIILKIKVPNKALLTLDYDTAARLYGTGHERLKNTPYEHTAFGSKPSSQSDTISTLQGKTNINAQLGVFGYTQKIPRNYIVEIWMELNPEAEWTKFKNFNDALRALRLFEYYEFYSEDWIDMSDEEIQQQMDGDW